VVQYLGIVATSIFEGVCQDRHLLKAMILVNRQRQSRDNAAVVTAPNWISDQGDKGVAKHLANQLASIDTGLSRLHAALCRETALQQ
jgi:hypothetical protein